jgi:peroxiredoxin
MRPGDRVEPFRLRALDGRLFDLDSLRGKPYLLSFNRFAGCPLCNLRMHELVSRYPELGGEFQVVAVFDSPLENLRQHTAHHRAPFPILADPLRETFYWYGVEHSLLGVLKGLLTRMHTLLYAVLLKGYLPFTIQGSITSMPADFLVDRQGVIRIAHYGKDEGDHLSFSAIRRFACASDG